jgi:tRNA threonylcarbamoyl adenosine modification protein YjeE
MGASVVSDERIRISRSLEETAAVARELAGLLVPGDCVCLEGELGAGKTTLVRFLVESLGGNPESVSSPTFVLLNIYPTPRCQVFHLDAYRIDADAMEAIGFDELLEQRGLVIVEWASRVADAIPKQAMDVRIEAPRPDERRFVIRRR